MRLRRVWARKNFKLGTSNHQYSIDMKKLYGTGVALVTPFTETLEVELRPDETGEKLLGRFNVGPRSAQR